MSTFKERRQLDPRGGRLRLPLHRERGVEVVGITAGASAPEEMVNDVIATLRQLGPVDVSIMDGREEHAEFRLPAELADPSPRRQAAGTATAEAAPQPDPQTAAG